MKKYSWIVVLLLALSLGFLGCGDPKEPPPIIPGEPVKTLDLIDNFQYGEGYQGLIDGILAANNNLTGAISGRITAGDQYTLKITFTADRELEDELKLGLVDRDPGVNYWKGLSWDSSNSDSDARETISMEEINAATKENPVTKIITFTIINSASTGQVQSNCLVFETNGDGTKGTAGSGVKGTVKLIFTEFVFVKGTEDDLPKEPVVIEPPAGPTGPVIENPEFEISPGGTHSSWNGDEEAAEDGSWTYITGGIRYKFPDDSEALKVSEYDFVKVEYTATGVASSVIKQYSTSDDYAAFSPGSANLPTGGEFTLELRNAASGGFTIQKWGGADPMTIKIDKLTFTKGTRHTVTLDANGGTVTPTSTYLVEETKVSNHLPVPTKDGYNFMGWKLGDDVLAAATEVTSAFADATLIAQWAEILPAPAINVTFTDASDFTAVQATVTLIEDGYEINYTNGYGNGWAKFTVDFGEFTLADYDKVSLTLNGTAGDATWKGVYLLAAEDIPVGYIAYATYQVSVTVQNNYTSGVQNIDLEIDKTKASALTAHELEVIIYVHSNPATFEVTNIVFAQND
jgi:hypothetical protein